MTLIFRSIFLATALTQTCTTSSSTSTVWELQKTQRSSSINRDSLAGCHSVRIACPAHKVRQPSDPQLSIARRGAALQLVPPQCACCALTGSHRSVGVAAELMQAVLTRIRLRCWMASPQSTHSSCNSAAACQRQCGCRVRRQRRCSAPSPCWCMQLCTASRIPSSSSIPAPRSSPSCWRHTSRHPLRNTMSGEAHEHMRAGEPAVNQMGSSLTGVVSAAEARRVVCCSAVSVCRWRWPPKHSQPLLLH